MTWFESMFGFREESPDQVRANLELRGETLVSLANGSEWGCGRLEIPSLDELRAARKPPSGGSKGLSLGEVVADVRALHADAGNAGALFQVASQFNLLEMASPMVTPESGIGRYEDDRTQGPACAVAAGAGTVYRNYLVPVGDRIGQTRDNQIDCLGDLGRVLGNNAGRLWAMTNGYALPAPEGLAEVAAKLTSCSETERDALRGLLRIGIHRDVQVTLETARHKVSQAYCSALPVAYRPLTLKHWAPFARLVLEASYEATLCVAAENLRSGGSPRVFLTLLGGGAFGNEPDWIMDSLRRSLDSFRAYGLEVAIVSYGRSDEFVRALVADFAG